MEYKNTETKTKRAETYEKKQKKYDGGIEPIPPRYIFVLAYIFS